MMASVEMLRPAIAEENVISIINKSKTIDFQLSINQLDEYGVKSPIELTSGPTNDKIFVALFDDKDVDFEIVVDNRSLVKDMGFDIIYGKKYKYLLTKEVQSKFRALEDNGHQLRFLSPNLPTAQSVVDLVANKDPDSREKALIMCSRMKFLLKASKDVKTTPETTIIDTEIAPKFEQLIKLLGPVIQVFVKTLSGHIITQSIGQNNTISDLKILLQERERVPTYRQRLISNKRQLMDDMTINESQIESESTIYMCLRLRGGLRKKTVYVESQEPTVEEFDETFNDLGKRGVIGFGKKTGQRFEDCDDVIVDENYYIQSFFIEFRLKCN